MTNGFIPESSLLLGIIPALILLYYSIKEWQGKFREKTLFIMFIVGIIVGFFIAVIQTQIVFTVELLVIYPFLEQILKMMILNLRRFHEKPETIIYGLGLGLGFGSIYPPASLLLLSDMVTSTSDLLLILLGSIGLVLLHGVTGAIIGYGVYKGTITRYYLYAVLILIIANVMRVDYRIQWINLIFGFILYWYVHRQLISKLGVKAQTRKRERNLET